MVCLDLVAADSREREELIAADLELLKSGRHASPNSLCQLLCWRRKAGGFLEKGEEG